MDKCTGCGYCGQDGISTCEETCYSCSRFYNDKWFPDDKINKSLRAQMTVKAEELEKRLAGIDRP